MCCSQLDRPIPPHPIILDVRTATAHFPGIGRYVASLAGAMSPLLGKQQQLILLRDSSAASPWSLDALESDRVHLATVDVTPFSLQQQWVIPRLLRHLGAGTYHSPYYLMPYRLGVPTVLTIHDLTPLLFPQYVAPRARLLFRWAMALAVRAATHVLTVSEATRRDVISLLGVAPDRVSVVPHAADSRFSPQPPAEVERVRLRYGLPRDYLLFVGINKPHKNLLALLDAWAQVRAAEPASRDRQLVIAGPWDVRYPEPKQQVERLGLRSAVRLIGFVAEEDLPGLYTGATLFIFPSLYEGFGLPVLEAMACGTPVACSNASSLPEVSGEAALFFDPRNTEQIAATIAKVLADVALLAQMREQGLARAAQYSWAASARKTLQIYTNVIQEYDR